MDVTVSELAVEAFFPAEGQTAIPEIVETGIPSRPESSGAMKRNRRNDINSSTRPASVRLCNRRGALERSNRPPGPADP